MSASGSGPYIVGDATGDGASGAVVFVHGFTGEAVDTWEGFPDMLTADPELTDYSFCFWGYPSRLDLSHVFLKYFWENDPDIHTIGRGLRTLLQNTIGEEEKLVLVGHSMGGLVIQSFILEELARGARDLVDRVAEIVLYATPSGGKRLAHWSGCFKNQVADMDDVGPFIRGLRRGWRELIEDTRAARPRPTSFRMTLVAGLEDRFVPEETALDPFPLDEHEFSPGNHSEVVKPALVGRVPFDILKRRLTRPAPSAEERRVVYGETPEAVELMSKIRVAVELEKWDTLVRIAEDLLAGTPTMPAVERALGLELLEQMEYATAAKLLERCLEFEMSDGSRPFAGDARVAQQLAVALSSLGRNEDALVRLESLPLELKGQSETMGIRAGRLKREWDENRNNTRLGSRVLDGYRAAYESALAANDVDQILYNGINTAYMLFELCKSHEHVARAVLKVARGRAEPDYWTLATGAEANLLLGEFQEAERWYGDAFALGPPPRHIATTASQGLLVVERLGRPPGAEKVAELLKSALEGIPSGECG
jgi:pimeloyl-ACP methyl ester carboxylesterase/tetratricopeptide (TPR) repeat protein